MECHKHPSLYFSNLHLVILPALLLTQVMQSCRYGQHVATAMIYHVFVSNSDQYYVLKVYIIFSSVYQ